MEEDAELDLFTVQPTRCFSELEHVYCETINRASLFTKVLLNAINFKAKMDTSKIKLRRGLPGDSEKFEPGTVFVLEVDVFCENNTLKVKARTDRSTIRQFFELELTCATRVLWIRSKSIRIIDAKLRVYEEYKHLMKSTTFVLQHELETFEDILKNTGRQKLKSVRDRIQLMVEDMPVNVLEEILQNASKNDLSIMKITEICHRICIWNDKDLVGNTNSAEYVCRSAKTVGKIKETLVHDTLNEIAKNLGSTICTGILTYTSSKIKTNLTREFFDLQTEISEELFGDLVVSVESIYIVIFSEVMKLWSLWTYVVTFVWSVDVNSKSWRSEVAKEIYEKVCERSEGIIKRSLSHIRPIWEKAVKELKEISAKLAEYADMIVPPDIETLVQLWKRREVFNDSESLMRNYPSIKTFVAGLKNGNSVVKVFLKHDDVDAKESVKKECQIFPKPAFQFEYPAKQSDEATEDIDHRGIKTKGVKPQTINKIIKTKDNKIDKKKRKEMGQIIKQDFEKLFANHTCIVGIGVGEVIKKGDGFIEPCIVLYSLDRTLVPFGERKLPNSLQGYPVDVREDSVMFGHCSNCPPIDNGCSIGRLSSDSSGSVGFLVRSNKPSSSPSTGFVTAAHVALDCYAELYTTNVLLSEHHLNNNTYKIVHPSWSDNNGHNSIVGKVMEACCGNFGEERAGIDAAFVKFNEPTLLGQSEQPIVDECDLTFDGTTFVTKTGRTTGETRGKLIDESLFVSVANPYLPRVFYVFQNCYGIINDNLQFFKKGDSGSGVYVIDKKDNSLKPLGIAFAKLDSLTAVCSIRKVLEAFDLCIYQEHEPMDLL